MHQQPALLEIYGIGDGLFNISLTQPPSHGRKANLIKTVLPVHINPYALQSIHEKLYQTSPNTIKADVLQDLGQELYNIFFRNDQDVQLEEIRYCLDHNESTIIIASNQPGIFWEILNSPDTGEYLSLRNGLTRSFPGLIIEATQSRQKDLYQCLLIQSSSKKSSALTKSLKKAVDQAKESPNHSPISFHPVATKNLNNTEIHNMLSERSYDIVHLQGAITKKNPGEPVFTAAKNFEFPLADIAQFLNGHSLAIIQISSYADLDETARQNTLETLAQAASTAGIQTLFLVYENTPIDGWQQFYQSLATGASVGEAVHTFKQHLLIQSAITWLNTFLFGNPTYALQYHEKSMLPDQTEIIYTDPRVPTGKVQEIGILTPADCYSKTWQILVNSALNAQHLHNAGISSINLFLAMLSDRNSTLNSSLKRFGFSDRLQEFQTEIMLDESALPEKVACSGSVSQAMALAQKYASGNNGNLVNESHLLTALIRQGGGNTSKWLLKQGIIPELLISKLFDDSEHLAQSVFEDNAWKIIQTGLQLGRAKNHTVYGRMHLIYAMLNHPESLLARRLDTLNYSPTDLAELFALRIKAGSPVENKMDLRYREMSTRLVLVFCAAELKMVQQHREKIGDDLLLDALLADGGGSAGDFLVSEGVPWPEI